MARIRLALQTPVVDLAAVRSGKSYWKLIVPERSITYYGPDDKAQQIDFSRSYLRDLQMAFEQEAVDGGTPFMLADADNRHTMDPERLRGYVGEMKRHDELPAKVANAIKAAHGTVERGLWGKIDFASEEDAAAVERSGGRLGVSARIRPNVRKDDGRTFKQAIIHVLGTLDPKVSRLRGWVPAMDFSSEYASDNVLDLSQAAYSEGSVSKNKNKSKGKSGRTVDLATAVDVPAIEDVNEQDIAEFSDEELDAFLAKYAPSANADGDDDDDTNEGDDDTDADDEGDEGEDDDTDEGADDSDDEKDTQMSNSAKRDLDLANATAQEALRGAREAQARTAAAEWQAEKARLLAEGIPAFAVDLAEPLLNRFDDLVLDLSNSDEDDLNVSTVVRGLLDGMKGMVDLSQPVGHGGSGGDADPDAELDAQFETSFPGL